MKVVVARGFSNSALGSLALQDARATKRSRNLVAVYGDDAGAASVAHAAPAARPLRAAALVSRGAKKPATTVDPDAPAAECCARVVDALGERRLEAERGDRRLDLCALLFGRNTPNAGTAPTLAVTVIRGWDMGIPTKTSAENVVQTPAQCAPSWSCSAVGIAGRADRASVTACAASVRRRHRGDRVHPQRVSLIVRAPGAAPPVRARAATSPT